MGGLLDFSLPQQLMLFLFGVLWWYFLGSLKDLGKGHSKEYYSAGNSGCLPSAHINPALG
jgi:hypothetical protein